MLPGKQAVPGPRPGEARTARGVPTRKPLARATLRVARSSAWRSLPMVASLPCTPQCRRRAMVRFARRDDVGRPQAPADKAVGMGLGPGIGIGREKKYARLRPGRLARCFRLLCSYP